MVPAEGHGFKKQPDPIFVFQSSGALPLVSLAPSFKKRPASLLDSEPGSHQFCP